MKRWHSEKRERESTIDISPHDSGALTHPYTRVVRDRAGEEAKAKEEEE